MNMNMKGVFLHVLGDALGSVVAVAVALCVWFINGDWKYYLDPVLSLIVACIIIYSGCPLVISCIKILMQKIPHGVSVKKLKEEILNVKGVESIHEFHCWQLVGETHIATIHLFLNERDNDRIMEVLHEVKNIFHKHGVHSTTVQTELPTEKDLKTIEEVRLNNKDKSDDGDGKLRFNKRCVIGCPDDDCKENLCCKPLLEDEK